MNNLKTLIETVKELSLDLQAIADEHDRYCLNTSSEDRAIDWLHSMPIETLSDSINRDHCRPRLRYSLRDMNQKFTLKKLHEKKKIELEALKSQLNLAKIDVLLEKIAGI